MSSTDTFVANNAVGTITFNRDGYANGIAAGTLIELHDKTNNHNWTRCLDINLVGMIASQSQFTISYWCAEKYLGVYFPAGDAAFSLRTAWCTNSAALAGMTCKTEPPTAPIASVFKISRRVTL